MHSKKPLITCWCSSMLLMFTLNAVGAPPESKAATPVPASSLSASKIENKVSINLADAKTLAEKLKGVGLKKAQAIVEYREKYGLFTEVQQLQEVPGVGKHIMGQNVDRLML